MNKQFIEYLVFCFTGKAPKPRTEMEAMAIASGASVTKSITRKTTTLVISDPKSMSSKAIKARSMGMSLISPEEFFELCGKSPLPDKYTVADETDGNSYDYVRTPPKSKLPDNKSRYSDKRRIQL